MNYHDIEVGMRVAVYWNGLKQYTGTVARIRDRDDPLDGREDAEPWVIRVTADKGADGAEMAESLRKLRPRATCTHCQPKKESI
jgi:hypothetical protein